MVDIVTNHMAWAGNHSNIDYDKLIPFNNESFYHSYCALNDSTSQTDVWNARKLDELGLTFLAVLAWG
jgi:alpha-amylase